MTGIIWLLLATIGIMAALPKSPLDKELWRMGKTFEEMVAGIEQGSLTALPDNSPVSTDPADEMGYRSYLLIKSLSQGNMPVYPKPPQRLHQALR